MKPTEFTSKIDKRQAEIFRSAATSPNSCRSAAHSHLAVARMLRDSLLADAAEPDASLTPDPAALHKCQQSYGFALDSLYKALAIHRGIIFTDGDRLVVPEEFSGYRLGDMALALGLPMSPYEIDLLTAMGLFLKGTTMRPIASYLKGNGRTRIGTGGVDPASVVRTNHLEQMDSFAEWADRLLEPRDMAVGSSSLER